MANRLKTPQLDHYFPQLKAGFLGYTKIMFALFHKNQHQVEISPSIVIFTAFFAGLIYFLYRINSILVLLFLAFIFMLALKPAVNKIQRRIKNRLASIMIAYILVLIVIASLLTFLIPPLVKQLYQLIINLNFPFLQTQINQFEFTLSEISNLISTYSGSVSALLSIITSTFSGAFTIVTLFVMSFYLMLEHDKLYLKAGWFSREPKHLSIAKEFLESVEEQLGGWVRGEFILMTIIGVLTYLGLILMRMPFALPLALMAGLLEILPNLGPTISAVPAIAIAYFYTSPVITGLVLVFYILIQQFENNLIVPKIMQKNADVNPLIGILSILAGFKIGGVIGALLAIPSYILLRTIYSFWRKYKERVI